MLPTLILASVQPSEEMPVLNSIQLLKQINTSLISVGTNKI